MIKNSGFRLSIPSNLAKKSGGRNRVLIIGFDAITFNIITPLIKKNKLPNIKKFMEKGTSGPLYCPPLSNSLSGWTSLITGTNIGKHGIFNFETLIPGSREFVATDSRLRANKPFWSILSEKGKKAVILNCPGTFPPENIEGIIISGYPIPSNYIFYTYPEHLTNELDELRYEGPIKFKKYTEKDYHEKLEEVFCLAEYLIKSVDWDCFFVVFVEPDKFQHQFLDDENATGRLYLKLDQILGKLLQYTDRNTKVIVVSDHGRAATNKLFYVERWLYQNGFLKLKEKRELKKLFSKEFWPEKGFKGLLKYYIFKILKSYLSFNTKFKISPFLNSPIIEWTKWKERKMNYDPIDYKTTKFYVTRIDGSRSNSGGIRYNKELFKNENSFQSDYHKQIKEITHKLKNTVDPKTKEEFNEYVVNSQDIYDGPMLSRLPDIIFKLKSNYKAEKYSWDIDNIKNPNYIEDALKSDDCHDTHGVFMMMGEVIKNNYRINASIMDIAPIILYLLGIDIPSYMDGKVLIDGFQDEYVSENPVKFIKQNGNLFEGKEFDFSKATKLDHEIRKELIRLGYEK